MWPFLKIMNFGSFSKFINLIANLISCMYLLFRQMQIQRKWFLPLHALVSYGCQVWGIRQPTAVPGNKQRTLPKAHKIVGFSIFTRSGISLNLRLMMKEFADNLFWTFRLACCSVPREKIGKCTELNFLYLRCHLPILGHHTEIHGTFCATNILRMLLLTCCI